MALSCKPSSSTKLFNQVLTHVQQHITDRWMSIKKLVKSVPAEYCEAHVKTCEPTVWQDLPNPHELAWAVFEQFLVPKLQEDNQYETRGPDAKLEIRLRNSKPGIQSHPRSISPTSEENDDRSTRPSVITEDTEDVYGGDPNDRYVAPSTWPPEEPEEEEPYSSWSKDSANDRSTEASNTAAANGYDPDPDSEKPAVTEAYDWEADHFHELAKLFPPMSDTEYQALKEDIRQHGQRTPILTYQGKLVDGRSRERACLELGIEPWTTEWDGTGSLLSVVQSLNLHRRHLSESQRAMVAARLEPLFEKEARQRMLAGRSLDPTANVQKGSASDHAAKVMDVSPRSVASAKKVQANGVPELVQAVDTGKVSVSAAEQLATLPPEEQKDLVGKGSDVIKQVAKKVRAQKSPQPEKMPETPLDPLKSLVFAPMATPTTVATQLIQFFGHPRATKIEQALKQKLEAKGAKDTKPGKASITKSTTPVKGTASNTKSKKPVASDTSVNHTGKASATKSDASVKGTTGKANATKSRTPVKGTSSPKAK